MTSKVKDLMLTLPVFNRIIMLIVKMRILYFYHRSTIKHALKWTLNRREISNFLYDLTDKNYLDLMHFTINLTNSDFCTVKTYFEEFKSEISPKILAKANFPVNESYGLGRRIFWYSVVRILKPLNILESGVENGLGALVIWHAMEKNRKEGFDSNYIGVDIDSNSGKFIKDLISDNFTLVISDSINFIRETKETFDLYINDSNHSSEYEYQEYLAIKDKLNIVSKIISDNSHSTDSLARFALELNVPYNLFLEKPKNHWYPGGGIGVLELSPKSKS